MNRAMLVGLAGLPNSGANSARLRYPGACGGDGQPAQFFATHRRGGVRDSRDVGLDSLPLAVEPAWKMLPPGLNLGHQVGCLQPLAVSLSCLALGSRVCLMRLIQSRMSLMMSCISGPR
jgi:hypothetical protein